MTCISTGLTQDVRCNEVDRAELEKRLKFVQKLDHQETGEALIAIGKSFLGTPYLAHTLEGEGTEQLVVTFQGLDCTTFVENVLAFYLLHGQGEYTFDAFANRLKAIRYRDGELNGYPSRLHYFTEWVFNNAEKGLIDDITLHLGGKELSKYRNFMSQHRDAYAALAMDSAYEGILKMEAALENRPYAVLDQSAIEKAESQLKNGDIIAFATSIDGLDVTHTGLAIWQGDRVHLLHASSSGQVEISKQPLVDYAKGIRSNNGLIIARVKR